MKKCLAALGAALFFLCLACKSPPSPSPAPEKAPFAALEFDRIDADSISHAVLYYRLTVNNPRSGPMSVEIKNWKGRLNGAAFDSRAAVLTLDGRAASGASLDAAPAAGAEKILALELDLSEIPAASGGEEYRAALSLDLHYRYANTEALPDEVSANAEFLKIWEPEFTITSIAIMQAELVNTRFKVSLRIDNPNVFPVTLSALGYELYGEDCFWADGTKKEVLQIPAGSSAETTLFLTMNFIDMPRRLLDDVIAMRLVRYRFSGEVEVGTGAAWLPIFHMDFDRSGNSVVLR